MLWAASFITWSNKPLLLVFPILWCKSQMEADIFLCCQLSFPINIRACLKVENKAMFELSNHKMHLKNVWACEKHPPFTCSADSEMSGWNLSWEQAWRITEQVAPVFSLKSVPRISAPLTSAMPPSLIARELVSRWFSPSECSPHGWMFVTKHGCYTGKTFLGERDIHAQAHSRIWIS